MYIRRTKYKDRTYYYLAQRIAGSEQEINLATIGSLDNPSANQEHQLLSQWVVGLMAGAERAKQKSLEMEKLISTSRLSETGRNFDLEKCLRELRAIYLKYGNITKTILEKQARPNGDLSYGVQTILKNLKRRNLSLKIAFDHVRKMDLPGSKVENLGP